MQMAGLKSHIIFIHEGKEELKCSFCGKE